MSVCHMAPSNLDQVIYMSEVGVIVGLDNTLSAIPHQVVM